MRKALAVLMILATLLALGCSAPEETTQITLSSGTPAPGGEAPEGGGVVIQPGANAPAAAPNAPAAPGASPNAAPGATPATGASAEPNASPDPNATPNPNASPSPTPAATGDPKSYDEARKINKDVIGWIDVPNTNIDYPILYDSSRKWYYNDHDIHKKSSTAGAIYSYYDNTTRNFTISGHNMRTAGTMFHELHELQNNKSSLTGKSARTFEIYLPGIYPNDEWEVFALYETKDTEPASTLKNNYDHLSDKTPEEIKSWYEAQIKRSEVNLGVTPSPEDFFITLITCGDNYDNSTAQSRLYFFLHSVS